MAGKGEVLVRIVGDAAGLTGALNQADGAMGSFGSKMESVGGRLTSVGTKMTTHVTLPIIAAGAAFANAAAQESQEMAILERTLQNTTGATDSQVSAVEEWITATQNATGVSDGELRPALGKLLIAGRDVEQSQSDMAVALDIAAARGVSLETVVNAMSKAALGSVGGMARLGLETKNTAGETLTYDEILQGAAATMGGSAAAAADTTAGKMAITKAKMADVSEEIGAALVPALDKMAGILSAGAEAFGNLSEEQQTAIVATAGIAAAIGPLTTVAGGAIKAVQGLSSAVTFLATTQSAAAIGTAGLGAALIGVTTLYASYRLLNSALIESQDKWNESAGRTVNAAALLETGVIKDKDAMRDFAVEAYIAAGRLDGGSDVMKDATANAERLAPQIAAASATLKTMAGESGITEERIAELASELGINLGSMSDEAREKLAGAVAQISAGVTPTERLDAVTETLGNEFATTSESVNAFEEALDALLGSQLNAEEAMIRVRQKTDELRQAIDAGAEADETAQQAKDRLTLQTIDLVGAITDEVSALVRNGEVAADSEAQHGALLTRLVALQQQFPELAGYIQTHIDKLNAVPRETDTTVTVDTRQAQQNVDRLINGLRVIGGSSIARELKTKGFGGSTPELSAFSGADDLFGALSRGGEAPTFADVLGNLRGQAESANALNLTFKRLSERGFSEDVLNMIRGEGTDALGLAQALESGSAREVNELLAQIESANKSLESTFGEAGRAQAAADAAAAAAAQAEAVARWTAAVQANEAAAEAEAIARWNAAVQANEAAAALALFTQQTQEATSTFGSFGEHYGDVQRWLAAEAANAVEAFRQMTQDAVAQYGPFGQNYNRSRATTTTAMVRAGHG